MDNTNEMAVFVRVVEAGNFSAAVRELHLTPSAVSLIDVSEKLEPVVGIPILGINAVTFWYALRENGFEGAMIGAGR